MKGPKDEITDHELVAIIYIFPYNGGILIAFHYVILSVFQLDLNVSP